MIGWHYQNSDWPRKKPRSVKRRHPSRIPIPEHLERVEIVLDIPEEKIVKLKSAVAEICVNAMEHGNRLDPSKDVVMTMFYEEDQFCVTLRDFGEGFKEPGFKIPDITKQ